MFLADEYNFSSTEKLDAALSEEIAKILIAAISDRGDASLVVSGGNTPKGMLISLSKQKIPWSNVTVLLADERWVDASDSRSNEKMVRQYLLQNEASAASFIGFYIPNAAAMQASALLEDKLGLLDRPIDALVLGMGEDGHTASLFPCAANIDELLTEKEGLKTDFVKPGSAPDDRITLSFSTLTKARHTFLHFTGDLKKEIYQKILSGDLQVPLGRVLEASKGNIRLYWAA
ncbi:MAG: 6-phosphogluconolactonase [Sneathiella sp.]